MHVAVGDDQDLVLGFRQHVLEIAHLEVAAHDVRIDDEGQVPVGKLCDEATDDRHRRIIRIPHPEDHLIGGVMLDAKRSEVLIELGIFAVQRLENGDRFLRGRARLRGSGKSPDGGSGKN